MILSFPEQWRGWDPWDAFILSDQVSQERNKHSRQARWFSENHAAAGDTADTEPGTPGLLTLNSFCFHLILLTLNF